MICPVASRLPELRNMVKRLLIFVRQPPKATASREPPSSSAHPDPRPQLVLEQYRRAPVDVTEITPIKNAYTAIRVNNLVPPSFQS